MEYFRKGYVKDALAGITACAMLATAGCNLTKPAYEKADENIAIAGRPQTSVVAPAAATPSAPIKRASLEDMVLRIEGKPKDGTIYHVGVMHSYGTMTPEVIQGIGRYQLEALRVLEAIQPEAVFAEENAYMSGRIDDIKFKAGEAFGPDNVVDPEKDIYIYADAAKEARELFADGVPQKPSGQQLDWLGRHGAAIAYTALHPQATFQMTIALARWRELKPGIEEDIRKGITAGSPNAVVERDRILMNYVKDYCKSHPRCRVAVTRGWFHDLAHQLYLHGDWKPRLLYWRGDERLCAPATPANPATDR